MYFSIVKEQEVLRRLNSAGYIRALKELVDAAGGDLEVNDYELWYSVQIISNGIKGYVRYNELVERHELRIFMTTDTTREVSIPLDIIMVIYDL